MPAKFYQMFRTYQSKTARNLDKDINFAYNENMIPSTFLPPMSKLYFAYRGRITHDQLQEKTIQQIQKFHDKLKSGTPDQLQARVAAGRWTAMEVAFHAVNTTRAILRNCDSLRSNKELPALERSAIGKTKTVSLEDLIQLCDRALDQVKQFDFSYTKTKVYLHPILGPLDFKQWLVMNLVHLERHYRQMLGVLKSR